MGWLKKVGVALGVAGSMAAVERGTAHAETAGHQEKMQTPHVEKYVGPEIAFRDARNEIERRLNGENTIDPENIGTIPGDNWKASVVQEKDGKLVAEVALEQGGKTVTKRFEIGVTPKTKKEMKPDASGNLPAKDVKYSVESIDADDKRLAVDAQATLDAALGKKGPPKGGEHIAMGEDE